MDRERFPPMWLMFLVLSLRISHYWMNYETDFSQPANLFKTVKTNHLTEQNTWAINGSPVSLPSIQTDGFLKQNQDLNIYLLKSPLTSLRSRRAECQL